MRNVYVVTHPESTHHTERLVGGWHDSLLTQAGAVAAASIGTTLRARIPAGAEVELYSSDLQRALQTARVIGDQLRVDVRADRRLREKSYGDAEGMPQAWLDQRFVPPPRVGDRMNHDEGIAGSETKSSLATRVYAAMEQILEDDCEYQIIVTHSFAATFVLASWIMMPIEALGYVDFRLSSGSITELRQDDYFYNRQVVNLNDVAHLPTAQSGNDDCCHPWGMQTVYEAAGGDEGLLRLARAWHAHVMADEVVSHAFSHGFHPEHSQRLAAYWAEALGGPATYSECYGDETSVVRLHSGNGPHEEMDRRAIVCFDRAMTDVMISENDPVRAVLHDYFAWATTTTMSRYHRSSDEVPDGLRIPHWSWDGLQSQLG